MILRTLAANAAYREHAERFRPPPEQARRGDDLFRELFERKVEEYTDADQIRLGETVPAPDGMKV